MTNTIYNATVTKCQQETINEISSFRERLYSPEPPIQLFPKGFNHNGWHYEDINDLSKKEDWWGHGVASLNGACASWNKADFFIWAYDNVSRSRAGTNYPSRICYDTLCGRVLPMHFGIYSDRDRFIQFNLKELRNSRIHFRYLSASELSHYITHEIERIEKKLPPEAKLARQVFSSRLWTEETESSRWFIRFHYDDARYICPTIPMDEDGIEVWMPGVSKKTGRGKWQTVFISLEWEEVTTMEETVISHFGELVGNTLTKEELQDEMDTCNFAVDNDQDKRVKMLNSTLMTEGMRVKKKRTRAKGKYVCNYVVQKAIVQGFELSQE